MTKFMIVALFFALVVGCSAQPTPTPTASPPTATETAAPTETQVPPAPTTIPTEIPPTAAPTQVPVTGTAKVNLYVRAAPSLSSSALGAINRGDSLTLVGVSADKKWFEINSPPDSSSNGWVVASLIEPGVRADTLPVVPVSVSGETPAAEVTNQTGTLTPSPGAALVTITQTSTISATAKSTITATLEVTPPSLVPAGSIIFDSFENGTFQINRVRADGTGLQILITGASEPALSPDTDSLAFQKRNPAGGAAALWVSSLSGQNALRIGSTANAGYPSWSPDGNNIAYQLPPAGSLPGQIHTVTRDGTGDVMIGIGVRPAWQPGSGELVLFDGCSPDGATCGSLFTVPAFNGNPSSPKLVGSGTNGAWSPDGSRIAFQEKDATGVNIYIVNRDGSNIHQVTKEAGNNGDPIWSGDGQWIFYRSDKTGIWGLYAIRADGSSDRRIMDAPVGDAWDNEKLAIGL